MQSSQDDEFAIGTRGNYRDGRHFELSDGSSQIQPGSLLYDAESGETRRIPRRTCAAAIILLMLGVIMLFTSLAFFVEGHPGYKAFGILGAIVVLPGAYATFQLYGSYRQWPGYDFGQVASYDYV